MSYSENVSDMIKEGKDYLKEEGQAVLKQGKKQAQEAGKDWWAYVENHPLQTMVFGIIGYFALKGMFKS